MRATVIMAVALVVISCEHRIKEADQLDLDQTPVQVVDNMFVVQTDKGQMQMRTEAPVMERYQNDTLEWEIFPEGFVVYAYDEEGRLETRIEADKARHTKPTKSSKGAPEVWAAYGYVVVKNLIRKETMETDTLYWDRDKEKIYTDCYVRLISPQGMMQGYGMESVQRARNSVLFRAFNNYGLVEQDTTVISIDTVNFIGPLQKK